MHEIIELRLVKVIHFQTEQFFNLVYESILIVEKKKV